jgi:SAM-dependent methyltransferase
MKTSRTVLRIVVVVAVFEWSYGGSAETKKPPGRPSIPYVATRSDTVQDMLWMANVGEDDVVYDLGSGDGRIVIAAVRDFGASRAVGIENDPSRIRQSRQNARKAGVTERVEFIQGDLFDTDFRQASVVTVFLGHKQNIKLRPKMLRILKPGARIVSHQFGMGEWEADKTLRVRTVTLGMWGVCVTPFTHNPNVPDYCGNERYFDSEADRIHLWVVPAPVAGIWRGKVETAEGPQDCQLFLHQRLSKVTGTLRVSGRANLAGHVRVDLWGDHIRFTCRCSPDPNGNYGRFEMRFDGHVQEDTMRGKLAVTHHDKLQEGAWKAHRNRVDYTGAWQWPCATGPRSVKLRIEQRDGQFIAAYLDGDQTLPVTDFYDFGGGFYFTLLIGHKGNSIRITEDTGWLIGEGILDNGDIKGAITFYPYGRIRGERKARKPVIKDWAPRLVKP